MEGSLKFRTEPTFSVPLEIEGYKNHYKVSKDKLYIGLTNNENIEIIPIEYSSLIKFKNGNFVQ